MGGLYYDGSSGSRMCSCGLGELSQDRDRWRTLVNAVMYILVQWNGENFLTSRKWVSFSRRTVLHGVCKYLSLFEEILNFILSNRLYLDMLLKAMSTVYSLFLCKIIYLNIP
jgi:hypothetical protein